MEQLSFDDLERWLPVPEFERCYEVSSLGRVRSRPRISAKGARLRGQALRPARGKRGGYLNVVLVDGPRRKNTAVHRLVAAAFIGPRPAGREVCHNDGNPANNALSNLRYGTRSDNVQDSLRHGTNHKVNQTSCPNGHEYTPQNTRVVLKPDGSVKCRICRKCRRDQRRSAGALLKVCSQCDREFSRPAGRNARKFCSQECADVAKRERERERLRLRYVARKAQEAA